MNYELFKPLQQKRLRLLVIAKPLNQSSPKPAYKVLETAWFSWHRWRSRFPKHERD